MTVPSPFALVVTVAITLTAVTTGASAWGALSPPERPAAAVKTPLPVAAVPRESRGARVTATPQGGLDPVPDRGLTPSRGLEPSREGRAWGWPLAPTPAVVRPFEPGPYRWSAAHRGVDLAGSRAQAVRSAGPGIVTFAGMVAGTGVVVVGHDGGLRTTYEPVHACVHVGSPVSPGDLLGTLVAAPSHCAPAVCLHWGALVGGTYIDPLLLLGRPGGPIVLLPVPPEGTSEAPAP